MQNCEGGCETIYLIYCIISGAQLKCQQFFFHLTTDQKFDIVIMVVILLNMMTMAMEHEGETPAFTFILGIINQAAYILESSFKHFLLPAFFSSSSLLTFLL